MSKATEHRGLPDDDSNLVQAQYEASGTIYGSSEPSEILAAFMSFAGDKFSAGHLGLVESDLAILNIIAEADANGVRTVQYSRRLDHYPAYETLSAVEVLNVEDVDRDGFLTDNERIWLNEQHIHALLIVPLVVGQRLIGMVVLSHPEPASLSSARIRALRSLADQAAVVYENQSLLRSTESTLEEVRSLYDINREMLSAQNIPDVLRVLRQHIAPESVLLLHLRFEPDPVGKGHWVLRHSLTPYAEETLYTVLDLPAEVQGMGAESVIFVQDISSEDTNPLFAMLREWSAAESYAILAFRGTSQIEDLIITVFNQRTEFDSRLRRLYVAVADQVSIVLENQRLLRDTQGNAFQLARQVRLLQAVNRLATGVSLFNDEKSLLDFAIKEMTVSLDADHGGLMLFDPEINYGTVTSEHPSAGTEGVRLEMRGNALFDALKEDPTRPFIVYDVEHDPRVPPVTLEVFRSIGIKSMMMVPVMMEGKLIASAGLDLYTQERQFTPEMIEIGQTMSAQLASGLLNIRLLVDAQRRAEQLERITNFTQSVEVTLDREAILRLMLNESGHMLPLHYMSIALYDLQQQELRMAALQDGDTIVITDENGEILSLDDTLAGDAWKSAQTLFIGDLEEAPRPHGMTPNIRSLLIAPIWSRGRIVGMIQVGSERLYAYGDTDVALFQQMITQFAIALDNSQTYAQSQRAAKNQALVSNITAQFQRNSDIQSMMQTTLEELGKALGARRARVRLAAQTDDTMNGAG